MHSSSSREEQRRSTATQHAIDHREEQRRALLHREEQRRGTATQHAPARSSKRQRSESSPPWRQSRPQQASRKASRSTATQHAPARSSKRQRSESPSPLRQSRRQQASSRTATEHATSLSPLRRRPPMRGSVARAHTVQSLTANEATRVAIAETLAERRDDSLEHLAFKLAEFLSELLRAHCWTESDAEDIVYAKIEEWSQAEQSDHCFGEEELLVHKKMYDVLTRDKQGSPKEYQFADWCRRVAACNAATEHATHDTFYKRLAENIYTHELTPQQKKSKSSRFAQTKASPHQCAVGSTASCGQTWEIPKSAFTYSNTGCLGYCRHPPTTTSLHQNCYRAFSKKV